MASNHCINEFLLEGQWMASTLRYGGMGISTNQLTLDLSHFYLNECFADVHFVVGPNQNRIPAHKIILSHRGSRQLTELIREKKEVVIKDIDSNTLKCVLAHLYGCRVDLNHDNVYDIHKASAKLHVIQLMQDCILYEYGIIQALRREQIHVHKDESHVPLKVDDSKRKWIPVESAVTPIPAKKPFFETFSNYNSVQATNNDNENFNENVVNAENNLAQEFSRNECDSISNDSYDTVYEMPQNEQHLKSIESDFLNYDIKGIIRCHDDNNERINVWSMLFKTSSSNGNDTLLSCGGSSVSFINYKCDEFDANCVKHQFIDSTAKEFFAIALTTLTIDGSNKSIDVIAAAGDDNKITLIMDFKSYRKLGVFKDAVSSLAFHPHLRTRLFSASFDKRVVIWDIGSLRCKDGTIHAHESKMLCTLLSDFPVMRITYSLQFDTLVASGESNTLIFYQNVTRLQNATVVKVKIDDKMTSISGIILVNEYLTVRSSNSDTIIIIDFEKLCNKYGSKQTDCYHINDISFYTIAHLKYTQPSEDKPFIYPSSLSHILACGNNEGQILLYDLRKIKKGQLLEPFDTLDWPVDCDDDKPTIVSVALSEDLMYLAAGTSNNLVCLWKMS